MTAPRILICDHPWRDLDVEREVLEGSGLRIVEPRSPAEEDLRAAARDVRAIVTCFARVTAAVIAAPDDLRIVARFGTGVDMIDVGAAAAREAVVTNVPEYCTEEVADHTTALVTACLRKVVAYDRAVRDGSWGLDTAPHPQRVRGRTLGVLGFGKIGRAITERGLALGMEVLVFSRRGFPPDLPEGARASALEEVASESDVVSIHLPLEEDTHRLVDARFIGRMRPAAWLVNTSRGEVIDEAALVRALEEGRIAGAALDVMSAEPPPPGHPLLSAPRTILTPHVAYYSAEAVARMRRIACTDVVSALRGEPVRFAVAATR